MVNKNYKWVVTKLDTNTINVNSKRKKVLGHEYVSKDDNDMAGVYGELVITTPKDRVKGGVIRDIEQTGSRVNINKGKGKKGLFSNINKKTLYTVGGAIGATALLGTVVANMFTGTPQKSVQASIVDTLYESWLDNDITYEVDSVFTKEEGRTINNADAFGGLDKYLSDTFPFQTTVTKVGNNAKINLHYQVKGNDVDVPLQLREDGLFVGTDGLVNTILPMVSKDHAKSMQDNITGKWLNVKAFRSELEQPVELKEIPYATSASGETLDKVEQVKEWVKSLDKTAVRIGKDQIELDVTTEQTKELMYILLQNTEIDTFVNKAEGTITIKEGTVSADLDIDVVVYGLQLVGNIDTNITKQETATSIKQEPLNTIDIREFIAYYFGLLQTDVVKFTDEEYKQIVEVIKNERVLMTKEERLQLLKDLNKVFFTKGQWEELTKLLTEELDTELEELTEEERAEREKRFKELQKLIEEKESEYNKPVEVPVVDVPDVPEPSTPTPSTSDNSAQEEAKRQKELEKQRQAEERRKQAEAELQKQQQEAESKAQQEAERRAQQEAERKAQEEAARRAQEEALKKAQEEALQDVQN